MLEIEWEKYLEEYENEYEKHIEKIKKEIPVLIEVFEKFEEKIYEPTKIYELTINVKDKLLMDLNEVQKEIIEKIEICEDNISSNLIERAFIYGFTVANKLLEESKFINNKKH